MLSNPKESLKSRKKEIYLYIYAKTERKGGKENTSTTAMVQMTP